MATNDVAICNAALSKIGVPSISSLSDSDSISTQCNLRYGPVRDWLLASYPWNFAIQRSSLTADATDPEYEFEKRFSVPANCLRVLELEDNSYDYKIEGGFILTNQDSIKIKYIAKITDTTTHSPGFDELLALYLAKDLCVKLVQSVSLRRSLLQELNIQIRDIRSIDAQEGKPRQFDVNTWTNARL
jgi:hypothetical protein